MRHEVYQYKTHNIQTEMTLRVAVFVECNVSYMFTRELGNGCVQCTGNLVYLTPLYNGYCFDTEVEHGHILDPSCVEG